MNPQRPDLWELTLPAVHAAREVGLAYIQAGNYVPRRPVTEYTKNEQGWSNTTSGDRWTSEPDAPVDWRRMFGPTSGPYFRIAVGDVPALDSAAQGVWEIAKSDEGFERGISLISWGASDPDERERQLRHEYLMLATDVVSRAEATAAASDEELLAIYLALEKARFSDELKGDLVVPLALTALDLDQPLKIADGVFIEPLDKEMQRARAVSITGSGRVSAFVIAAATHAIVERGITVDNSDRFARHFSAHVDLSRVDRVVQCLHILTGRETGYAQAVVRPADWADDWDHDLPAVWKVGNYHQFPDSFDDGAWNKEKVVVPRADIEPLPDTYRALEAAPPNVQLAARRVVRAMLRTDDEDETLDAAIGIEALLLGNNDRDELTHRMAQRAAAVLASDGFKPAVIYGLVKRFYTHRSKIVHGRIRKNDQVKLGDDVYQAQDVGVILLRLLLINRLRAEPPWTPESIDARILAALATPGE